MDTAPMARLISTLPAHTKASHDPQIKETIADNGHSTSSPQSASICVICGFLAPCSIGEHLWRQYLSLMLLVAPHKLAPIKHGWVGHIRGSFALANPKCLTFSSCLKARVSFRFLIMLILSLACKGLAALTSAGSALRRPENPASPAAFGAERSRGSARPFGLKCGGDGSKVGAKNSVSPDSNSSSVSLPPEASRTLQHAFSVCLLAHRRLARPEQLL